MLIRDGKVFTGGQFQEKELRVENGRILEIAGQGELTLQDGEELLELNGRMLLPGLVDVHSHGRAGEDFNFADLEGLKKLCDSYASCGVTSVLGTTMTNEPSAIARAMDACPPLVVGFVNSMVASLLLGSLAMSLTWLSCVVLAFMGTLIFTPSP